MTDCPETVDAPDRVAYSWPQIADTGLLYFINRELLHPRGLALAIENNGEAGWSLHSSPDGEPFTFALPDDLRDSRERALEALFEQAYTDGCSPEGAYPAFRQDADR
jgi:hypothetical protein